MGTFTTRSRWAAIGAAVAVSLGAGGLQLASASNPEPSPVLTTIGPCRLVDTRPGADNVGPRATPLGDGETFTTAVRGSHGECTIPAEAIGVTMNVTIVSPTGGSFLTVFPGGTTRPSASNLNWTAGQGATPNAVTTALGATGAISLYNHDATVHVIVDITGYLTGHDHDDQYAATRGSRVLAVPGDGDPEANGAALRAAVVAITDATAEDPYLVEIGPGTFDLGDVPLEVPSFVTVAGSGQRDTEIRSSASGDSDGLGTGSEYAESAALVLSDANEVRDLHLIVAASDNAEFSFGIFVRAGTLLENMTIDMTPGPGTDTPFAVVALGTLDFQIRSSTLRTQGGTAQAGALAVVSAEAQVSDTNLEVESTAPNTRALFVAPIQSAVEVRGSTIRSSGTAVFVGESTEGNIADSLVEGAVIDLEDPANGGLTCVGAYDAAFVALDSHCEAVP